MKVAISGHQDLGTPETTAWVENALEKALSTIKITKGYTCLAVGADQMFAKALNKRGVPYVAVLACSEIESSFQTAESVAAFRELLSHASGTIKLTHVAPSEKAYFDAGKMVVDKSDVLIAIWNGQPAKGLGGTGDVVSYALAKGKNVIHIDLTKKKITTLKPHMGPKP